LTKRDNTVPAYNRRIFGSARCTYLDPNPRSQTSDTRQPLSLNERPCRKLCDTQRVRSLTSTGVRACDNAKSGSLPPERKRALSASPSSRPAAHQPARRTNARQQATPARSERSAARSEAARETGASSRETTRTRAFAIAIKIAENLIPPSATSSWPPAPLLRLQVSGGYRRKEKLVGGF
jgi:hypothetical protein